MITASMREKIAGAFVLGAIFMLCAVIVASGFKQGWFTRRVHYWTALPEGNGLTPGAAVEMAGVKAGTVESISLADDNRIRVELLIDKPFARRLSADSQVLLRRPSLIGDKVVEVTIGHGPPLKEGSEIQAVDGTDLMDFLSSGHLGPYLQTLEGLMENMRMVAEAFSEPARSKALVALFDEMLPTLKTLRRTSSEVNDMMPDVKQFSKNLPALGETSEQALEHLTRLSNQLESIMPYVSDAAPEGKDALRQTIIVLKAMQKSFLLRGAVQDVKKEEEEEKARQQRLPSGYESHP